MSDEIENLINELSSIGLNPIVFNEGNSSEGKNFVGHFKLISDVVPSCKGGVTVVMRPDGRVGVAVCSPEDNYNKKKGRAIAEGRANSKSPTAVIVGGIPEDVRKDSRTISKLLYEIADEVALGIALESVGIKPKNNKWFKVGGVKFRKERPELENSFQEMLNSLRG